jgi:hypothetical protein
VDGILGHNLLLSRAFLHNLFFFFMVEFWLSESLFHELSFFTMEFWLSGSLSHELFLFHDGILAIRKPFSQTFSFFTMEFWLSGSLSHELFLFHDGILAIRKPFSRTFSFSRWNSRNTRFGGRLFIYISQRVFT